MSTILTLSHGSTLVAHFSNIKAAYETISKYKVDLGFSGLLSYSELTKQIRNTGRCNFTNSDSRRYVLRRMVVYRHPMPLEESHMLLV